MSRMDRICSACQAGVPHDCSPPSDPQKDLRRCIDCEETFNRRSARLGSPRCPRCDRRRDRR